jgi:hypothetical protein
MLQGWNPILCKEQRRRFEASLEGLLAKLNALVEDQKRLIERQDRWFARWEKEQEESSRRFELHLKELETPRIAVAKSGMEIWNDPIEKRLFKVGK